MVGELRAVVERDRLAELRRQRPQNGSDGFGDRCGCPRRPPHRDQQPGAALVQHQHRLPGPAELHPIRLPVAKLRTVGNCCRALRERAAVQNGARRTAPPATSPTATPLPPPQEIAPRIVLRPRNLRVDEPVDTLIGDDVLTAFSHQPPRHCLRRPAQLQLAQHIVAELVVPVQPSATPAPCMRLLVGIYRPVATVLRAVALQLPSNRRWRAIQSCCDLPDRAPLAT